jgi:hypothetical protein
MPWSGVPPGAFVLVEGRPVLALEHLVVPWTAEGYLTGRPRPRNGSVEVVTPPSTVAALGAGYPVQIDPSATDQERAT